MEIADSEFILDYSTTEARMLAYFGESMPEEDDGFVFTDPLCTRCTSLVIYQFAR